MQSAGPLWTPVLDQPVTWVVVASNYGGGAAIQYLLDGDDANPGQSMYLSATPTKVTVASAGGSVTTTSPVDWFVAGVALAEINGSASALYFNDFTTPAGAGTITSMPTGVQDSMTLGSHSQSLGGGSNWDGTVAEIIAYNGILAPGAKQRLRQYLNGRYALNIA